MEESQLRHWSLECGSLCLDLSYPDKAILARVSVEDFCQGPMTRKRLVLLEDYNVSFLEVGVGCLPLAPGLQSLEVLSTPPVPEMLDNGLA